MVVSHNSTLALSISATSCLLRSLALRRISSRVALSIAGLLDPVAARGEGRLEVVDWACGCEVIKGVVDGSDGGRLVVTTDSCGSIAVLNVIGFAADSSDSWKDSFVDGYSAEKISQV
jgi:hypothetical protein